MSTAHLSSLRAVDLHHALGHDPCELHGIRLPCAGAAAPYGPATPKHDGRTRIFELVDDALERWLTAVAPKVAIEFDTPGPARHEPANPLTIHVFLMGLLPERPVATQRRHPLQARLQYLVSVCDGSARERHALLGRLVFAALEQHAFEVALGPIEPRLWCALGVPPRPAFWLHAPVHLDGPGPGAPQVLTPPDVQVTPGWAHPPP